MTKYFSVLLLLPFFSCNDQSTNFDIGSKYVDVRTTLRFIDTLTIKSYTVRLDSVRTSGLTEGSFVMAGQYHDPNIGDVSASGYFRIGLPGVLTVPHDATFDSIKLIIVDNNYIIGDTLTPIKLNVHRLTQTLKTREDGYLYNTSSFGYNPELLGSVTFTPRTTRNDTVKVKLDDTIGQELFNLIKTKDDRVLNADNFFSYFKGLVFTFDESDNAILGFQVLNNLPAIRVYFHYFNFTTINKYLEFAINNPSSLQFNHFSITNPVRELPDKQIHKLPSRLSDNQTIVEGGTGLVTRFEIPYLRNLRESYSNIQILRAELILEPARNTYKNIQLPEKISLYSSDRLNRFGIPIRTSNGNIMTGFLVVDDIYQEETTYSFDVTDFINSKLFEETDDIPALLLSITPEDLNTKPDRLILGSQGNPLNKIKLRLYYMNYE